jgi:hypothetical protein
VAAVLAGVLLSVGAAWAAGPALANAQGAPSVVIVGVPGLRWKDVTESTTPYLWELSQTASIGQMSTRSARSRTCPADGWVQLGTGNRARYPVPEDAVEGSCPPLPAVRPTADRGGQVDGWNAIVAENDELAFDAVPGLLGQTVIDAGSCVLASGDGAALGAADTVGEVPRWLPEPVSVGESTLRECPFTVVAADPLTKQRDDGELRAVDELVRRIDTSRPAGSLLMVLGVSDLADERAQLHTALLSGPGFTGGVLSSGSTRREPFVQLSDVAPTVLTQLGISIPQQMTYQPMVSVDLDNVDRLGWFDELSQQANVQSRLTPPFFGVLVLVQAVLYLGAFLILRRHPRERTRSRILTFTTAVAVAAAAGPAATYLANVLPWWQSVSPVPSLLVAISLAGALLTAISFIGPWRRHPFGPAGAVSALSALVLVGDLMAGAPLQLASLAGYSPIVAGRFVGFGNLAFALFGTAMLLATAALVSDRSQRFTSWTVLGMGVAAVVIDGAPGLGSDFGGVIALVPAFGTLWLLATGRRVSWLRLGALFGGGLLAVSVIATLDYLRPPDSRTHLGRFVQSLIDGDAGVIVQRKLEANASLLTTSVLTLMVPLVLIFLAFLVRRPSGLLPWTFVRVPTLRAGLFAVLVLGVVGALVNDSGVAIPAMAATLAIPVAVAVVVRCMQLDDERLDPTASPEPPAGAVLDAPGAPSTSGETPDGVDH